MWREFKKLAGNEKGFTLTEVMVGITILTVAIVSATNLLVGLVNSNQNNLTTLQAYYLSQEGLEAVRNIRDTNWLHNQDWLGDESSSLWGDEIEIENNYSVSLEYDAFNKAPTKSGDRSGGLASISDAKTWMISNIDSGGSAGGGEIFRHEIGDDVYLTSSVLGGGEDTGFKRTILIKKYDCGKADCDDSHVLVESKVEWKLGAKNRELVLSEVLTDWKKGAL